MGISYLPKIGIAPYIKSTCSFWRIVSNLDDMGPNQC